MSYTPRYEDFRRAMYDPKGVRSPYLREGLVGWWPFISGGGLTALDFSGQGNHGTLTNGPTWTKTDGSVYLPSALDFDGVNDYVDLGPVKSPTAETFTFWIKTTQSSGNKGLISFDGNSAEGINLVNDDILYFRKSPENFRYWRDNAGMFDGVWHHVAVTCPGGAQSDITSAAAYLDGQTLTPGTTWSTTALSAYTNGFRVGKDAYGAFNGLLDDICVYNRDLSVAEVQELCYEPQNAVMLRRTVVGFSGVAPPAFAGRNFILGGGVI